MYVFKYARYVALIALALIIVEEDEAAGANNNCMKIKNAKVTTVCAVSLFQSRLNRIGFL